MRNYLLLSFLLFCLSIQAQVNYTANDQVPPYEGHFRLGSNMGAYSNWDDVDLANIAGGNTALGQKGAGVRALRPALPEKFLEFWGYDIRATTFQHYTSIDLKDNTVFIGYPSEDHQDPSFHCSTVQSQVFDNLYTDIWDGGANGTPVNDDNYYALYLYKMVSIYKDQVKFWEIWNEPDFDLSGNGWKPAGMDGNWFENIPDPCDYHLRAPIYHYIRMLRISYEVIKTVDPSAYIAVGGLGYPSFLDLIMRHSDNPNGGSITNEYPLLGGAYFDVMSYHAYPHFDGSLRYWSNDVGGFVYTRHSDAAAAGVIRKQTEFQEVMANYGYDGNTYPEKLWIITESNIPRLPFGEYIGSPEAQRNFLLKTVIACQQADILQYHLYLLADAETEAVASNEFQVMGFYQKLEGINPYQQKENPIAIAGRSLQALMYKKTYDPMETQKMQLSDKMGGGAFKASDGEYTYILWAKTETDQSESASTKYSFPASMGIDWVERKQWNFSETQTTEVFSAVDLPLTGDPIFLNKTLKTTQTQEPQKLLTNIQLFPNPGTDQLSINFDLSRSQNLQIELFDSRGGSVKNISPNRVYSTGNHVIHYPSKDLKPGIYFIQFQSNLSRKTLKWVKTGY